MDRALGLPRGTPRVVAAPAPSVGPGRSQRSAAGVEHRKKALAKSLAHEAVGDGVTAGRHEGQKMNKVHGHGRDARQRTGVVEHAPRL